MADHSHIEWTDATWNPVTGCSIVSPGCTNCYAMKLAGTRLKHHPSRAGLTVDSKAGPVWTGEVRLNREWLDQPLTWKRPRRIFVCAHGDLFAEGVPDEWIDRIFAVMALCPQHTFQVLTKRADRMRAYLATDPDILRDRWYRAVPAGKWYVSVAEAYAGIHPHASDETRRLHHRPAPAWPLPNVWLGVSAERQQEADERIPELLATPAAIRFVSAEPLLGPIDFTKWMRHEYADHDGRRVRLPGGAFGGIDDRRAGSGLALGRAAMVPVGRANDPDPLPTEASGARHGEIPAGTGNDRLAKGVSIGTASRLETFQRADSQRADDQSQGREQEAEPSGQSGIGDDLGTGDSCNPSAGMASGSQLSWVIVGGESGQDARPMHPAWARAIRDQCAAAQVPFFFKQWGSWLPGEDCIASEMAEDLELRDRYQFFGDCHFVFEGKKRAGRLLDGVEHNGMPAIREVPAL